MKKNKLTPRMALDARRDYPQLTYRGLGQLLAARMGRSTPYTDGYVGRLLTQGRKAAMAEAGQN